MAAPSAANQQPWEFFVVTNKEKLEADELDLGAVWLGVAPQEDRMSEVRAILNIPEHLEVFAIVPCGYPVSEVKQQDRFEKERVHYIQ